MDPHTATSKAVANKMNLGNEVPVILPTTAHYSKFSDVVLRALNARSDLMCLVWWSKHSVSLLT